MVRILVIAGILATVVAPTAVADATVDAYIVESKRELDDAVASWSVESLAGARAGFERLLGRGGRDWLVRYYIALADYRIAIHHTSVGDPEAMDPYLDDAIEQLESSVEENPDFCDSYGLMTSILGLKISRNPISGMWIGPKIGGIMEEARRLDPENPRVWLFDGIGAFHRPKVFGGGADKAKKSLLKSIECFERQQVTDPALPYWGHSEAYAWLGKVEMASGELELAREHLEEALRLTPDMGWVSYQLMPELEQLASEGE